MRGKKPPISSHLAIFFTSLFGTININPAVIQKPKDPKVFFISKQRKPYLNSVFASQSFILTPLWMSASHVLYPCICMWMITDKCKVSIDVNSLCKTILFETINLTIDNPLNSVHGFAKTPRRLPKQSSENV